MSSDTLPEEKELQHEKPDLIEQEIDEQQEMIFEETRHTALLHLIERRFVPITTKIEKNKFDKIMRMLTFVRLYKMEMKSAMEANDQIKEAVLADCNLYLDQINDYMLLMKSKGGWTADEFFAILKGEEKSAKKWGFIGSKKEDKELEE